MDSVKNVRFTWYHYGLERCPLTRERIASGKSVTNYYNVVEACLNRANGRHIFRKFFPVYLRPATPTITIIMKALKCTPSAQFAYNYNYYHQCFEQV